MTDLKPPVPIPDIMSSLPLIPEHLVSQAHLFVQGFEFRAADTLEKQIRCLHKSGGMSFQVIAMLLNMPKSTVHLIWQVTELRTTEYRKKQVVDVGFAHPHSAMTILEEQELLEWITAKQKCSSCPTVSEVRIRAGEIAQRRTRKAGKLTRWWWKGFKRRYIDKISTQVAAAKEKGRAEVTVESVSVYIGQVVRALSEMKSLCQMVNMDESGFHSRLDKGRERRVVTIKDCPIPPAFREEPNSSQVTVVVSVSLSGDMLMPMFLTKENISFKSEELLTLRKRIRCVSCPKGYQVSATMIRWVEDIFAPYVQSVQQRLGDPNAKVFLIMDNCSTHNTDDVTRAFQAIHGAEVIWLPAHASHFLQMLDSIFFGVMKAEYRNGRAPSTRPKVEGKIVRAYQALWRASLPSTVCHCWQTTGFMYRNVGMRDESAVIDMARVLALQRTNCPDWLSEELE